MGGFLSHEGGKVGQRRFDICHKKVVLFFEGFPYQNKQKNLLPGTVVQKANISY